MRAIIIILILAVLGFLAYNYFFSLSEEEKMVTSLEDDFDQGVGDFLRAVRNMAGTGLDTTSEVDLAVRKIKKAEKELQELMPRLHEEAAKKKAEKLEAKIRKFTTQNDINLY
jgi:uncharacterized membrane protein YukC